MAFDFPSTPTLNQEYAAGPVTYKWNGVAWDIKQSGAASITPAALTKVDDANVTMTLDGTPATALLQATNMTLGWTGTLSVARGGTGAATAAAALTALGAVAKIGDTMTGNLQIANAGPILSLNKTPASGGGNYIFGYGGSLSRWRLDLGDSIAESATAVGSNFAVHRYNNAGTFLGTPLHIDRELGAATFSGGGVRFHDPAYGAAQAWIYFTSFGTGWDRWIGFSSDNCMIGSSAGTGKLIIDKELNINPTTGAPLIVLDPDQASQQALISCMQTAVTKWTFGKNTDNAFIIYDAAKADIPFSIASNGVEITLARVPRVTPGTINFGAGTNYISQTSNSYSFVANATGAVVYAGTFQASAECYKPGGGPWASTSDARIKNVEGEYTRGLADVIALRPVYYTYKGNDTNDAPEEGESAPYPSSMNAAAARDGKKFAGMIAQEVEAVFPEMVKKRSAYIDGVAVDDLRDLDTAPLILALINAVKELKAEVEQLKATR